MDEARQTPPPDQALCRLEQLLAEQLSLAKAEDFEALSAAVERVDQLIREASQAPLSPGSRQRLTRIIRRHQQVGLVLAQKTDELARKLRHCGRGRRTLRAYRRGPA